MIHLIADDPVAHEPRPMGNQHTNKVTAAERRAQQAHYYAMNRDRLANERRAKYRDRNPIDRIALEAARIARIVSKSGSRLVIIICGNVALYKPATKTAMQHYANCRSIVGTYAPGVTAEQIEDDLRAVMV